MTKKIERLKEVNNRLTEILGKLETRIFIENIDNFGVKKIKESQPNIAINLK